MLKKILGFAPKLESDGSYSPSKIALKMGVSDKTDFENINYQKYQGEKLKILVIFTEEKNLKMKNGKFFSTGNHPVEALLPMLHLKNAGFEFEEYRYLTDGIAHEDLEILSNLNGIVRNKDVQGEIDVNNLAPSDIRQLLIDQPKCLERPVLIQNGKAVIGRPPELILEYLVNQ